MKFTRIATTAVALSALLPSLEAQKPKFQYDVEFSSYFDNREYELPGLPQTIFAFDLRPSVGIGIDDSYGGKHALMAGISAIQPLGSTWRETRVLPVAYYDYRQSGWKVKLGAVPYNQLNEPVPHHLLFDSIAYAHPIVQGAIIQYQSNPVRFDFFCDWRGAQANDRREAFRLYANGSIHPLYWTSKGRKSKIQPYIGLYATLNHLAGYGPESTMPYAGVSEQLMIQPYIGVDMSRWIKTDSLSLRASYLMGIDKMRSTDRSATIGALEIDFYFRWKRLAVRNLLHYGSNILPYYAELGNQLYLGDPYFSEPLYNRTDLSFYIFDTPFANCRFSWNLHFLRGRVDHQQQLTVQFQLSKLELKKRRKK